MDRFSPDFYRIFGGPFDGPHIRHADDYEDIIAQLSVESGKQLSAAANRFAAPDYSEASPTRTGNPTEGESHG